MNILYVSVHQVLEYDEISIFHDLGHEVFPLGLYFGGIPAQPFRPAIPFGPWLAETMREFEALGGQYRHGAAPEEQTIPRAFVERFDAVVVAHDLPFIRHHWDALSATTVVWRSIGVSTEMLEPEVAQLRDRGVVVVRYCPTEQLARHYAGHDAIIRFGKRDADIPTRTNGDPRILTFSLLFRERFPREYAFYVKSTGKLPTALGGAGTEALPGGLGLIDHETQRALLSTCAAYFYCAGTFIPYTLNFMEAWLAGIPLVALHCRSVYPAEQCRLAEVPLLLTHGEDGFVVRRPSRAASVFRALGQDEDLAREIGARGALRARSLFSSSVVGPQWQRLFDSFGLPARSGP